ncbi:MAG: polysaccharide ABC transporter ATP-binding protein [Fimbriiglobus sp.]
MSDTAISVRGLGKRYTLGGKTEGYHTFQDQLKKWFAAPRQMFSGGPAGKEFWALSDVDFDVPRGQAVGVIGRNGAGKSTLLKILSRITEPTTGSVDIYGRVGSLLEVGTGFHPELTGRENVFLNGAILGMRRAEIARKFDEIVAFAEVEEFIDTPVKRYSSGMYVRLAFAVAAHLEPEILIVDEVLAVGDAQFQKKCLGRMEDVAQAGRTVLFVSHNMTAVSALCNTAVYLSGGKIDKIGPTAEVVRRYIEAVGAGEAVIHTATENIRWLGVRNLSELGDLAVGEDVAVQLKFSATAAGLTDLYVDLAVTNARKEVTIHARSSFVRDPFNVLPGQAFVVEYRFESPRLSPGDYTFTVYARSREKVEFYAENVVGLSVSPKADFGQVLMFDKLTGAVVPKFTCNVMELAPTVII